MTLVTFACCYSLLLAQFLTSLWKEVAVILTLADLAPNFSVNIWQQSIQWGYWILVGLVVLAFYSKLQAKKRN